jgi:hypothetical protein
MADAAADYEGHQRVAVQHLAHGGRELGLERRADGVV